MCRWQWRRLKSWQRILIVVGVLLLAALLLMLGRRIYWHNWHKKNPLYNPYTIENTYAECWLSDNISFRKPDGCYNCDGFLYDSEWKVDYYTPALRWIQWSPDDSLAVGAISGRRGYFDRYTGEQVLPFDYTRAWLFSEGVAAVTDTNDNLFFIDKRGNRIIDKGYRYTPAMRYEGYRFHCGNCIMVDSTGHYGLINHTGVWSVEPQWTTIYWRDRYWEMHKGDMLALYDSTLRLIVPLTRATESCLIERHNLVDNILVEIPGKASRMYSMDGRLLFERVFESVEKILYSCEDFSNEVESSNEDVITQQMESNCLLYRNRAGMCGLLDKQGNVLTDAIYYTIEAINKQLFRARLDCYVVVLLDDKGKVIN